MSYVLFISDMQVYIRLGCWEDRLVDWQNGILIYLLEHS